MMYRSGKLFGQVQGYALGWQPAQNIAAIGDSVVRTDGSLIIAKSLGHTGTSLNINGVPFVKSSSDFGGLGHADASVYNRGGIGSDFESLMDSFNYIIYGGTINGLIVEKTYLLQLFVEDDRVPTPGRVQSFTINGQQSEIFSQVGKGSIIYVFIASATSVTFTTTEYTVGAGAVCINGYQIRKLN